MILAPREDFGPEDRHPLTPFRLVLAVALSFLASIAAIILALAILAFFILSGGGRTGPTLGTTVHPRNVVVASSSRSRPVSEASPDGTAQLRPRPDFSRRPGGVA